MEQIHERLKSELTRHGITAAAAARAAGMPDSQGLRDTLNGRKRVTADLLALVIPLGIDALYVLTGQRAEGVASDPAEQVLLDSYRRCKPAAKANLIQTAALLSAGLDTATPKRATRSTSGVQVGNQTSTHDGAVQVGYAGGSVRVGKK